MKMIVNKLLAIGKVSIAYVLIIAVCDVSIVFAQPGHRAGGGARTRPGSSGATRRTPGNNRGAVNRPNAGANRPNNNNGINRPNNTANNNGNRINNNNSNHINNNSGNRNSGNTTININNSHNTVVRQNNYRPYSRPPYVYGGRSFYSYHPYAYHPYHPFYWGPAYHPWGFFIAALATTAIIVTVANQQYHYDQGVYYAPSNGGYTVVQAPVGAVVTTIPSTAQTVAITGATTTNNYYYGGTFYEKSGGGYTVVPPTAGAIVTSLPEGGKETKVGDVTYVKYGDTYYQPIKQDGKDVYEVVKVDEVKQ